MAEGALQKIIPISMRFAETTLILRLFTAANGKICIQYDTNFYIMEKGLAIRTNQSPDAANLCCSEVKRKWPAVHHK